MWRMERNRGRRSTDRVKPRPREVQVDALPRLTRQQDKRFAQVCRHSTGNIFVERRNVPGLQRRVRRPTRACKRVVQRKQCLPWRDEILLACRHDGAVKLTV